MAFILVGIYIFLTVIAPLRCNRWWKLSLALLTAVACEKLRINSWLGSDWFSSPDNLPAFGVYLLVFIYGFGVIFLCLTLLSDLLQVAPVIYGFLRHRLALSQWLRWRQSVHAILAIVSVPIALWGIVQGTQAPEVEKVDLWISDLPEKAEGITFAVLADTHADSYFSKGHIRSMVEVANSTQADFMVLVGDYVDGEPERRRKLLSPLADLRPRKATLGVSGNHEYLSGYGAWKPILEEWEITMLDNAHVDFPDYGISIIGVTDPLASRFGHEGPDACKAVTGRNEGLAGIALAHRPGFVSAWDAVPRELRPVVQLSGHTHGGMMPVLRVVIGWFNGGYSHGLYQAGDMQLYVSRGAGIWNGFPFRVLCPAEITLIRLCRAPLSP